MRKGFTFEEFVAICVLVAVVVVLLVASDGCSTRQAERSTGVVIGRQFTPSSVDVGNVVGANSKPGVVITPHSEKWTVIVRRPHDTVAVQVPANQYADLKDGTPVELTARRGWLFGMFHGYDLEAVK